MNFAPGLAWTFMALSALMWSGTATAKSNQEFPAGSCPFAYDPNRVRHWLQLRTEQYRTSSYLEDSNRSLELRQRLVSGKAGVTEIIPLISSKPSVAIPPDGYLESRSIPVILPPEAHVLDLGSMDTIERLIYDFPQAKHFHFSDIFEYAYQRRRQDLVDRLAVKLTYLISEAGKIEIVSRGFLDDVSADGMNAIPLTQQGADLKKQLFIFSSKDPLFRKAQESISADINWEPGYRNYIPELLARDPSITQKPIVFRVQTPEFGLKFIYLHPLDFHSPHQVKSLLDTIPDGRLSGVLINQGTNYPKVESMRLIAQKLSRSDGWFIKADNLYEDTEREGGLSLFEFETQVPDRNQRQGARIFIGKAK